MHRRMAHMKPIRLTWHPSAAPRRRSRRLLVWAWLAGACVARAWAATDVAVEAERQGAAVEINARATVDCAYDTLWSTLTDYDHLAQFIPGMHSSRVLEWRGNEAVVEQRGEAKFLFFRFPIEVTVGSASRPPDAIDIRVLKGNLHKLDGGYRIEKLGESRYILRWRGLIQPAMFLPPVLGTAVMRSNIADQFLGMVREIERREAARTQQSKERS